MKKESNDILYLFIISVIAVMLRLDFLFSTDFLIDSDEAIVGLMAKHILEGKGVPVFYYGQAYMGSLEAIIASALFYIFGISSVALKCVPLMFSIFLIPITYLLGVAVSGKRCARAAALLIAVPPSPLVIWSGMARGGFLEIVCLIATALLLTIYWLRRPTPYFTGVIGLLLGLGWWINNQVIFCMLPIGLFMLLTLWQRDDYPIGPILKNLFFGTTAFLIGSAPWWYYNVQHNWASLGIFGSAGGKSQIVSHFVGLISTALPMLLAGKLFWHTEDIFPFSSSLVLLAYGLVILYVLSQRASSVLSVMKGQIKRESGVELLLVFLITSCLCFALSSYGHLVTAPRYLLPIYPAIFIFVGILFERAYVLKKLFSFLLLLFFVGLNLYSSYPGKRAVAGQPFVAFGERAATNHEELIAWLSRNGITMVQTNYWIGYRLAFETKERTRFAIFQEPSQIRIPEYQNEFKDMHISQVPMILVPSQAVLVKEALRLYDFKWEEKILSGYSVIYNRTEPPDLRNNVPRNEFVISASHHNDTVNLAVDGDLSTRWGSGAPQNPEMVVNVKFTTPQKIREIRIHEGSWQTDMPRGLLIEADLVDGTHQVVLNEDGYKALRYYDMHGLEVMLPQGGKLVKAINFVQTGRDNFFDWSIAELDFLR